MTQQRNFLDIQTEYSNADISTLFDLVLNNKVSLFIDSCVSTGDIAAWMLCRCWFNQFFWYYGVCADPEKIDIKVSTRLPFMPNATIQSGLCQSNAVTDFVKRLIDRQYNPVLYYVGDGDVEKLFDLGVKILRSGDIIVASRFPTEMKLAYAKKYMDNEKMKRLVMMKNPSLFVGVIQ